MTPKILLKVEQLERRELLSPTAFIVANGQAGYEDHNFFGTEANPADYGGTDRWARSAKFALVSEATWTIASLTPGQYRVQVAWAAYDNVATNSLYLVYDGPTLVASVQVDQTQSPVGTSYGGVPFQQIAAVNITSGTLRVVLSNAGTNNKYVVANAVRTELVPVASGGVSLFSPTDVPAVIEGYFRPVTDGVRFKSDIAGTITGLRFYKGLGNTGTHVGRIYTDDGTLLDTVVFVNETESGWQQQDFAIPIGIEAGVTYVVTYYSPKGRDSYTDGYFAVGHDSGPLHVPAEGTLSKPTSVYAWDADVFPTVFNGGNPWVDIVFTSDSMAPEIMSHTPGIAPIDPVQPTAISVLFNEEMNALTVNASTVQLLDSAGNVVPATVTYYAHTANLTPAATLAYGTTYSVLVHGVQGADGTPIVSVSFTFSTAVAQPFTGDFITTPYDRIPNFAVQYLPKLWSVESGNWSDPKTWSGNRVPGAGDIASIFPGTTVTYDVVSAVVVNTVAIQADGHLIFRTDIDTMLTVVNLLVLPGGFLWVGDQAQPITARAQIIFADAPINLALDPEQYGNGLIALGTVTMNGDAKISYIALANEAHAGDTTLTLAQLATGWRVGDKLIVPDTRELDRTKPGQIRDQYVPEWETVTIAAIAGSVLTLAAPLAFDHLGARDPVGALIYLPDVANLTRNVVVRSANAAGTRGHVLFTGRANIDIENVQFGSLGRTTKAAIDNTAFDANGNVSHAGTNQSDRYPVYFDHLIGPAITPADGDGFQYTFSGNSVFCSLAPMPFIWGLAINDSNYGLISGNVVYNWAGAGLICMSGQESYNVIEGNFVVAIRGDETPRANNGMDGTAYWFKGVNNYIRNNVAADAVSSYSGIVAGSGYYLYWPAASAANTRVPLFPGADVSKDGQYKLINMATTPILEFSGNTVYGATACGLSLWELYGGGVIKNFTDWHVWEEGCFAYPIAGITFDGYVVLGDATIGNGYGWTSGDYLAENVTIVNANIQGMGMGIGGALSTSGTFTIKDSYFRNGVNISLSSLASPGSHFAVNIASRKTLIDNVRFDPIPGLPFVTIVMDYTTIGGNNFIALDTVTVTNYNGVAGDNFRVYYTQQAADFVVPQTTYYGDPPVVESLGCPEAGLTNAETMAKYGIAIAGGLAPADAKTRQGIVGLVK